MNWDRIEKHWAYYEQLARQRWAKITIDELDIIAGRRQELVEHIQDVYRITLEAARKQVQAWQRHLHDAEPGSA